ncbi:MAG: phosphate ABC transporter permease subunit PstC [Fimbriiglobus sp.]
MTTVNASEPSPSISRPPTSWEKSSDIGFRLLTKAVSVGLILSVVLILGTITFRALPAIQKDGADVLTGQVWDPNAEVYGIRPHIWGTVYTSLIALTIATIFGVSAAIFLSERFLSLALLSLLSRVGLGKVAWLIKWPDRFEYGLKTTIELLAAIPSVVYGLWGIFIVIPNLRALLAHLGLELAGPSVLPASFVLAIMVLPTITAIARDALLLVPPRIKEASYGMGATRWQTLRTVVLPMSAPGVVGGVILAFGRALGETMALAMLVGNANVISWSLLSPANTLAALLANNFPEANQREIGVLMYAALALFAITLSVNTLGNFVLSWTRSKAGVK